MLPCACDSTIEDQAHSQGQWMQKVPNQNRMRPSTVIWNRKCLDRMENQKLSKATKHEL